jgi:hypothetical protein
MGNYKVKIDLSKLRKSSVTELVIDGQKKQGVFIPIEDNNLFVSQKSNSIYLDMTAYTTKNDKYGQSHILKQKMGGVVWRNMTEDEKRNIPIVGSLQPDEERQSNANNSGGYGYQQQTPHNNNVGGYSQPTSSNDLPF